MAYYNLISMKLFRLSRKPSIVIYVYTTGKNYISNCIIFVSYFNEYEQPVLFIFCVLFS